jgi:hypothetical protein
MFKKNILSIIIVVLLSVCSSYAGTIDPYISDNEYVKYAQDFNYVGKLCGTYIDGSKFCASGVAIDDHHILTAAHVVKDSKSCFIYFDDKEFCLTDVTIHKDFDTKFGVADIAIAYSKTPFGLKFYPPLYSDTDEIGKTCSISGYGITGTFKTGAFFSDQKKRAGSNVIDNIQDDILICSPSTTSDKTRTSLEFMIASGDSGGGLFIGEKLAGINSCVMAIDRSPKSKYNEESGHTRIQKFIPWIKENKIK